MDFLKLGTRGTRINKRAYILDFIRIGCTEIA